MDSVKGGESLHRNIQRLQQSSTTTHSEGFLVTTGLGFFKHDLNDCDLLGRLTVKLALEQNIARYLFFSSFFTIMSTIHLSGSQKLPDLCGFLLTVSPGAGSPS